MLDLTKSYQGWSLSFRDFNSLIKILLEEDLSRLIKNVNRLVVWTFYIKKKDITPDWGIL
jgi:hypothetical protein